MPTSPLVERIPEVRPSREVAWLVDVSTTAPELARAWGNGREALPAEAAPLLYELGVRLGGELRFSVLRFGRSIAERALRSLVIRIGETLGENVSRNAVGDNQSSVILENREDPTWGGIYTGNAFHDRDLGPHVDGAGDDDRELRVVALLYLEPSHEGGDTIVSDAWRAVESLSAAQRRLLARPWKRLHPYQARGAETMRESPILIQRPDDRMFSYNSYRHRWALDAEPTSDLEERLATLDAMDHALAEHAFRTRLETGDVLFLDNAEITHGRTSFMNRLGACRRLMRLWIGHRAPDFGQQIDRPIGRWNRRD